MKLPAYRRLKAARPEASPDGAVASDQNLSRLNVIGEGMLASECHSLDTEQKGQDASFPKCQMSKRYNKTQTEFISAFSNNQTVQMWSVVPSIEVSTNVYMQ